MKANIIIRLKKNILDPQGKAVHHALSDMQFGDVEEVRIGRFVEMVFNHNNREQAEEETRKICDKLLANPIMEVYDYTIED